MHMPTSKQVIRAAVLIVAVGLGATHAFGYGSFGSNVNDSCASSPYAGDCSLCHVQDKSAPTDAKAAYMDGDFCFFCPDDASCAPQTACTDADGDGYFAQAGCPSAVDCNDTDPNINPQAIEVCNDAKDNDCNGAIDWQDAACAAAPLPCTDADGDGWCAEDGDCNDTDPEIFPGATDLCLDGIDQDCSGADRTKGKGCPRASKGSSEGKGKTCSDGMDNDGDAFTDCADSDCNGNRACR